LLYRGSHITSHFYAKPAFTFPSFIICFLNCVTSETKTEDGIMRAYIEKEALRRVFRSCILNSEDITSLELKPESNFNERTVIRRKRIQGVTGGTDQTSGGCSLC